MGKLVLHIYPKSYPNNNLIRFMKLLLTSFGLSTENIKQAFIEQLPKPIEENTVLIIFLDVSIEFHQKYIKQEIQTLIELGILEDNISVYFLNEDNPPKLNDVDVLCMGGGNTYRYMKKLREQELVPRIRSFIENDGFYIGASAGGVIMSPEIDVFLCQSTNDVDLDDLSTFGFVDFYIVPHWGYTDNPKRVNMQRNVESYAKDTGKNIIPLTDQQAILVQNKEYKII